MHTQDAASKRPALAQAEPSTEKLQELILYIAWLSENDPTFGATKLNKLLFYSDFEAYAEYGQAITWQEYRCMDYGPVPAQLTTVGEKLKEENAVVVRETDFFGHPQQRVVALRRPDLSMFTGQEIAIVHAVVDRWRGRTAIEISEASHERPGWKYARYGEVIPYEAALLVERDPTTVDVAWASQYEQQAEAMATGTP